ncbi:hypothetical protein AOQ71_12380 [Bradyrhizobium manausense]|uniref:Uncharacterized protein n=1 Tax=Bradyrhizobium manausense TaxID=989370 RepID=A0A0R3E3U3_9BRAD|nr:hypothetical protein AOQ71_12380 [Bradyrhizobium manausense]
MVLDLVVLVDPEPELVTSYRVTCTERQTGWVLGSTSLPAAPEGGPPTVTLSDVTPLLGSSYRLASVLVEVESERLARLSRRTADRLRHRDRSWLRRAKHLLSAPERPIPYESLLERDWLARTDATEAHLEPAA